MVRKTEGILNLLKLGNEQTLEQIDSTLSASATDVKKSCCLWMQASVKEIDLSLWRSFQDQSYQMITQYVDQSAAIKQSVTGQVEPQYILCNVPTGVPTCQASQVPTVPRVTSTAMSAASAWVSDPDHHDRGPHEPVVVFFDRPGKYPYLVCYPN